MALWENSTEVGAGSGGRGEEPNGASRCKASRVVCPNTGEQTLEGQGDGQEVPAIGYAGNQGPENLRQC